MPPLTQAGIARELGVSQALVARALKNDPLVALATRQKIQMFAEQSGYRPNASARALVTGRSGLVGLWIARAFGSYSARVIFALERLAAAKGIGLVITDLAPPGDAFNDAVSHRLSLDGLIVVDAPWQVDRYLSGPGHVAPCVSLGTVASEKTDRVVARLYEAVCAAMEHLAEQGCRRISYLTPDHPLGKEEERMQAYLSSVRSPDVIRISEPTRACARETMFNHLKKNPPPDALFCHNDDYAIGAIRALRDAGVPVPGQTAVIGCDGSEDAEYVECPLSTIRIPVEEMCVGAWDYLIARLEGYTGKPRARSLKSHLVVRASSTRG